MPLRFIPILLLVVVTANSFGQSRKHKKRAQSEQQATSLEPSEQQDDYAPKVSRKSSRGPTYQLEEQYYHRMADLEKAKKKNDRLMTKPQYSDPLYFGHKHPPKKRKPSRMKFCKECGIRH